MRDLNEFIALVLVLWLMRAVLRSWINRPLTAVDASLDRVHIELLHREQRGRSRLVVAPRR